MKTFKMVGTAVVAMMFVVAVAGADTSVTIQASSGDLSASHEFTITCNDGIADWSLDGPMDLMADDVLLGTITELCLQSDADPYVNLFFAVQAGAADTTFDVSSGVVSFFPLMDVSGYASAGVTLTSDADGATITGLFGGDTYEARYNSTSVFADLVAGYTIGGDVSVTNSDRYPATDYTPIAGNVSSIESEFKFTLSALDQASGTSRFEIIGVGVPEPATMSLLALGGLALLRRRRS